MDHFLGRTYLLDKWFGYAGAGMQMWGGISEGQFPPHLDETVSHFEYMKGLFAQSLLKRESRFVSMHAICERFNYLKLPAIVFLLHHNEHTHLDNSAPGQNYIYSRSIRRGKSHNSWE
jgi:hypothetical protein